MVFSSELQLILLWASITTAVATAETSRPADVVRSNLIQAQHDAREYLKDEKLQRALDQISRSSLTTGNLAHLLVSGIMSSPVRKALIDGAKRYIFIDVYSINAFASGRPDEMTNQLMVDLANALSRGVKVNILVDGFTSAFTGAQPALLSLRRKGASIIRYQPINYSLESTLFSTLMTSARNHFKKSIVADRMHEKVLLVDGRFALVGGLNWGDSYGFGDELTAANFLANDLDQSPLAKLVGLNLGGHWGPTKPSGWRDTDILLYGPVVQSVARGVLQRWITSNPGEIESLKPLMEESGAASIPKPSSPNLAVRYLVQQPLQERQIVQTLRRSYRSLEPKLEFLDRCPQANISNFYVNTIRRAKRQILWGGHSVTPVARVSEELIKAANRGVKIFLITNSKEASRALPEGGALFYPRSACWAKMALARTHGNLRIFEWQESITLDNHVFHVGAYHSKTFAVDGYISSIGSYNIAPSSYCGHTENTAVVVDAGFTQKVEETFVNDLQNARELQISDIDDSLCRWIPGNENKFFAYGYLRRLISQLF